MRGAYVAILGGAAVPPRHILTLEGDYSSYEFKDAIEVERDDCSNDFIEWRPGLTLREHKEMIDRKWMLEREERLDNDTREWRRQESESNRRWRKIEFATVLIGLVLIVAAAFIERGGQPTINIITQEPPIIEQQP